MGFLFFLFFFFLQFYANLSVTKFSCRVIITCTFIFQNMYMPCMTQACYLWCVFTSELNIFHDHAHVRYHVLGHMRSHVNHAFKVFLIFYMFNHATMLKRVDLLLKLCTAIISWRVCNLLIWIGVDNLIIPLLWPQIQLINNYRKRKLELNSNCSYNLVQIPNIYRLEVFTFDS